MDLIPDLLLTEDFQTLLEEHKSKTLDSKIDEILESVDVTFLRLCDNNPTEGQLQSLNFTRLSLIKTFERLKIITITEE